jgi:hypothetical protein
MGTTENVRMDKSTSVHLADDDQIKVVHQVRPDRLDGYPLLWIKSRDGAINCLDIFPGIAGLRRIVAEGAAYLAEHDEEGNRRIMDRAGVVPAEACCGPVIDVDDLMGMAANWDDYQERGKEPRREDFEVREEWSDPSDAEIAAGVRNAPGQVP